MAKDEKNFGALSAGDWSALRQQFPILRKGDLCYLDNAATTHKPSSVIEAMEHFYRAENATVHRGAYALAEKASLRMESVREQMAQFMGVESHEVVFTSGTTHSLNIIAQGLPDQFLKEGDEIVVCPSAHHANLIPWQELSRRTGAALRFLDLIPDQLTWDLDQAKKIIGDKTKLVAVAHTSNSTGIRYPFETLVHLAHDAGALFILDAAQAPLGEALHFGRSGVDFAAFSGHKMFGPTGIGILYGKAAKLASLRPDRYGGDMIRNVTFQQATYAEGPRRFEGGTPHLAGIIGLGQAIQFIEHIGIDPMRSRCSSLVKRARSLLLEDGWKVLGSQSTSSILSFYDDGIHPHDIATLLNQDGIAIRAGHHCAHPFMRSLGLSGTARLSFAAYNTMKEVDQLMDSLKKIRTLFS